MIHQKQAGLFFVKAIHADLFHREFSRHQVERRRDAQKKPKEKALPHGLEVLWLRKSHDLLIRFLFDLDFHRVVLPFQILVERVYIQYIIKSRSVQGKFARG
jgi:hypothetical protein